jgi:C-terminal peptidase prc
MRNCLRWLALFLLGVLTLPPLLAEEQAGKNSGPLPEADANRFSRTVLKAIHLIGQEHYKPVPEESLIGRAITALYQHSDEKIPKSIQDQLDKIKDLGESERLQLLETVRRQLGKREALGAGQDIAVAINAALATLDRHSTYTSLEELQKIAVVEMGSFKGVGMQIRRNEPRDLLQVVTPIFNGPAHKADLRADDLITAIVTTVNPDTGKPYPEPKIASTRGMSVEDAVKLIRGKEGTELKLRIERAGVARPLEVALVRWPVEMESVLGYARTEKGTWNHVIDPVSRICYIRLNYFTQHTASEVAGLLGRLSREGINGLVLDLRFNPGGLLAGAVDICDLFVDSGPFLTVRPRNGAETHFAAKGNNTHTSFPIVCLVNGSSASASEVVASCLQDHGRASILGSRSLGKASVQTINRLEGQGFLKLTCATFWSAAGRNLDRGTTSKDEDWGVRPEKGFEINLPPREENDLLESLRGAELIRGVAGRPGDFTDRQLGQALTYLRNEIRGALARGGMSVWRDEYLARSARKAIERDPKDVTAHVKLGNALRGLGKLKEAIAAFGDAIELSPNEAPSHFGLAQTFLLQGNFVQARESFRRAADLFGPTHPDRTRAGQKVRDCERLQVLEKQLPALLSGQEQPKDNADRLLLAGYAALRGQHPQAVRLYRDVFAAEPNLVNDLAENYWYIAACSAALVAAGLGEDAQKLTDAERASFRKQALDWLRAQLAARSNLLEGARIVDREASASILRGWQRDSHFHSLRDEAALKQLSPAEQQDWRKLWADVAALVKVLENN